MKGIEHLSLTEVLLGLGAANVNRIGKIGCGCAQIRVVDAHLRQYWSLKVAGCE